MTPALEGVVAGLLLRVVDNGAGHGGNQDDGACALPAVIMARRPWTQGRFR